VQPEIHDVTKILTLADHVKSQKEIPCMVAMTVLEATRFLVLMCINQPKGLVPSKYCHLIIIIKFCLDKEPEGEISNRSVTVLQFAGQSQT
jgi:hypothetical protein